MVVLSAADTSASTTTSRLFGTNRRLHAAVGFIELHLDSPLSSSSSQRAEHHSNGGSTSYRRWTSTTYHTFCVHTMPLLTFTIAKCCGTIIPKCTATRTPSSCGEWMRMNGKIRRGFRAGFRVCCIYENVSQELFKWMCHC